MNCKQGDLAVIIRCSARPDLVGRLVECLFSPPIGSANVKLPDGFISSVQPGTARSWVVRFSGAGAMARASSGMLLGMRQFGVSLDANLRPIRDQPGEDETLTWACLPQGHEVSA